MAHPNTTVESAAYPLDHGGFVPAELLRVMGASSRASWRALRLVIYRTAEEALAEADRIRRLRNHRVTTTSNAAGVMSTTN